MNSSEPPKFENLDKTEVLQLLSEHKKEGTYLPQEILKADAGTLKRLSDTIKAWFNPQNAVMDTIANLMQGNTDKVVNANPEATIEQRTDIGNYDLIAWDYVSEMD